MSRRRIVLLLLVLAAGACAGLLVARNVLLPPLAAWLDVSEAPRTADDVMLLTGDENTRPFMAAALVKGGWAKRVLITPVRISPQVQQGTISSPQENARRVLLHCGLTPEQVVFLDGQALSTYDEAQALSAYLKHASDHRILLVTDAWHSRRARWIFTRVLGRRTELIAVSAPFDQFTPANWWRCQAGFVAISSELLKLAFYGVWYGTLGYVLLVVFVALLALGIYRRRRMRQQNVARDAVGNGLRAVP